MKMKKISILISGFFFLNLVQNVNAESRTREAIKLIYNGNIEEAKGLLIGEAAKDDAEACFFLSQINLFGKYKFVESGLTLLRKSISLGFAPAMDTIAGYYLHGEFLPRDHHAALMYYQLAANRGYGPSQFNYGIMLKNGEKTPQDLEDAFVYLALAALNVDDLGDISEDAAGYRNEVASKLSSQMYQDALIKISKFEKKH